MNIQLVRNIEQFLSLQQISQPFQNNMICHIPPFGLQVDVISEQLMITSWSMDNKHRSLIAALDKNSPEYFFGVPHRVFSIDGVLYVTGNMPPVMDGRMWNRLCEKQRLFIAQTPQADEYLAG